MFQITPRRLPLLIVTIGLMGFGLALKVGCGTNSVDPGYEALVDQQHELPPTGQLGVGDQFRLRVYNEDSLSGEFSVASDGTINYPHIGRIEVAGMTCAELEEHVSEGLQDGILRSPSVSCSITEYNSQQIFVFGEVQNPGSFPYRSDISIIEAFALAGGFSERARKNDTKLTRVVDGREIQIGIPMQDIVEGRQQNLRLLPGDVIYVPESAI